VKFWRRLDARNPSLKIGATLFFRAAAGAIGAANESSGKWARSTGVPALLRRAGGV
jgi:hypothetical protein